MQCILPFLIKYSYLGIFAALGLGILGLPIPDETLMALAGFLAFKGTISYPTRCNGGICRNDMRYFHWISSGKGLWASFFREIFSQNENQSRTPS